MGSSENESNELNAQVLSQETASIQLLTQPFSGNIDLNQLMTQAENSSIRINSRISSESYPSCKQWKVKASQGCSVYTSADSWQGWQVIGFDAGHWAGACVAEPGSVQARFRAIPGQRWKGKARAVHDIR